MKNFLCALVIVLSVPGIPAGHLLAQGELVDGIAAIVNKDVITYSQVREVVGPREQQLRAMYTGQELVDKVKEARLGALKDLIDRQLVLQDFKKQGFQLPEHVVDGRVQQIIREEFGNDRQAFVRTLQAQGYSLTQFKELERDKIIVQAMRQRNVKDSVVSPTKIAEYYSQHRSQWETPEQVKLRMIMVKKANGGKSVAEEIRQKVKDGAEFDKMAQMYSDDTSRESGGDWGWIDRKTLNETLTKAAFSLGPGAVSQVITLGDNFYVLKVEEKKKGSAKSLDEVRPEIEKKLGQTVKQDQQQKWIDSLREKAFIKMF